MLQFLTRARLDLKKTYRGKERGEKREEEEGRGRGKKDRGEKVEREQKEIARDLERHIK